MTQEADGELLLTDYLLNFDEDDAQECFFEGGKGFSSGDDFDDEEKEARTPLSTLKESLGRKAGPNTPKVDCLPKKSLAEKEKDRIRAREYRAKKVNQLKSAEDKCQQLKDANNVLSEKNTELEIKVASLEKQVEYLENVISNESALSAVLGAVAKHSGLSFTKNPLRVNSIKRKRVEDDETVPQQKKSYGGVCLHLMPGQMSLEFCRECDISGGGAFHD